jgi:anti-sigma B factor antagonist
VSIHSQKINNIAIILVDLERATTVVAESFKNSVQFQITSESRNFIFDLSKCEFIDSTFLSALVTSYKRIAENGGELRIVGLQPAVDSMFKLTRLSRIFDIFKDEKEALNSFNK